MRILIAVDRSEYSEIVIEHALDRAARSDADELHFLTVVETNREIDAGRRWLEAALGDLELLEAFHCTPRSVVLHVRPGQPAAVIMSMAEQLVPDLLVIGRFHVPSAAELVPELVHCPILVVGIDGNVLEPQCPACEKVRRESDGELMFCEDHAGDYLPDLVMRLPPYSQLPSRLW